MQESEGSGLLSQFHLGYENTELNGVTPKTDIALCLQRQSSSTESLLVQLMPASSNMSVPWGYVAPKQLLLLWGALSEYVVLKMFPAEKMLQ